MLPPALRKLCEKSPFWTRIVPFLLFAGITSFQGVLGPSSAYWLYFIKTVVGAWIIVALWPLIEEMRWRFSWMAVGAGILVFVLWVGLDGVYPSLSKLFGDKGEVPEAWNPHLQFGQSSPMAWFFIVVRIAGSTLVVPPLEEVFYRSTVYRWIVKPEFHALSLGHFNLRAFLITSVVFGVAHNEWLAGILCGLIYQALVVKTKRLGDAMTAHAITNFMLGIWVVSQADWKYW